jgi:hypothetical protein
MAVQGTTVSPADTPDGVALTFVTNTTRVDDVRQRVRAMAEMHNRQYAAAAASSGTGMGTGSGDRMMTPPSSANVEDVPGGSRLMIRATRPEDVSRLRASMRDEADRMQREGCTAMAQPR